MRPFQGSDRTAVVRWYWCNEDVPLLGGPVWRSSAWYLQDIDGQYPPPPPIGEERSAPFRWSPGKAGQALAVAECLVGDPAWFASGIPASALVNPPPPIPACCQGPVVLGLGGLRLGGFRRAVKKALGGLRLGGRALRRATEGGLRLGGGAGIPPELAQGGLLLGGSGFGSIAKALGGLLLGGQGAGEVVALKFAYIFGDATQTVPTDTNTVINFQFAHDVYGSMWPGPGPNESKIICPDDGLYLIITGVEVYNNGTPGGLITSIYQNGVLAQQCSKTDRFGTAAPAWQGVLLLPCSAGDVLQVVLEQNSGVDWTVNYFGDFSSFFEVVLLGPLAV